MAAEDNIKTIQAVYEAFGRGDVNMILDNVTGGRAKDPRQSHPGMGSDTERKA